MDCSASFVRIKIQLLDLVSYLIVDYCFLLVLMSLSKDYPLIFMYKVVRMAFCSKCHCARLKTWVFCIDSSQLLNFTNAIEIKTNERFFHYHSFYFILLYFFLGSQYNSSTKYNWSSRMWNKNRRSTNIWNGKRKRSYPGISQGRWTSDSGISQRRRRRTACDGHM